VATHGFFFGDPVETKKQIHVEEAEVDFRGGSRGTKTLVENSNPLMRSGIVMAGANDIWNEENTSDEDGVLTAYEVSLLNLQNTKLAVLSACETGLGDIKGSEGVYGLQRAFKMAGVKQLVMSLWQVPDKETEEFMTTFYASLVNIKDIHKAFAMAQKTLRLKYEPYFWGAFVLIE
jgi:CHAT domain-containing protein